MIQVLEYTEASAMTRHLDYDEKGLSIVQTPYSRYQLQWRNSKPTESCRLSWKSPLFSVPLEPPVRIKWELKKAPINLH